MILHVFLTAIFVATMAVIGISHPESPGLFYGTAVLAAIPTAVLLYRIQSK